MYRVRAGLPVPTILTMDFDNILSAMDFADECWENGCYCAWVEDIDKPRDMLYYVEDFSIRSPDERTYRKKKAYRFADKVSVRKEQDVAYKSYEFNIRWSQQLDSMFGADLVGISVLK